MATVYIVPSNDGKQRSAFPAGDYVQLGAPTGLAVSVSGFVVSLSWSAHNGGSAETKIEFSVSNGPWQTLDTKSAGTNTHSAALFAGEYSFRVLAVSGNNVSPVSASVAATIQAQSENEVVLIGYDNFDSGSNAASLVNRTFGSARWVGSANSTISNIRAFTGSNSMRLVFVGTGPDGDSAAEPRFDLGAVYSEITIRFKWYVPANYRHRLNTGNNNKFIRLWGTDYGNIEKIGASLWNGATDTVSNLIVDWNRDGGGIGPKGQTATNFVSPADYGTWVDIVFYAKMESAQGALDGVTKVWKNGQLVINNTNMDNWHSGEVHGWRYGYLMGWSNSGYTETTEFFIDDLYFYSGDATEQTATLIVNDDFESATLGQAVTNRKVGQITYQAPSNTVVASAAQFASGSKSLAFTYNPNTTAEQRFTLDQAHPEITIRMKFRVPDNYLHSTGNNKFFALWMDGYSSGGQGPTITPHTWPNGSGGSTLAFSYSEGGGNGGGIHLQYTNFINVPADRGTWIDVAFYVKAATTRLVPNAQCTPYKQSDGLFYTYIKKQGADWIKIHELTTANIAPPPNGPAGWMRGYLMGWANGAFAEPTTFYIDDLKVYSGDARNEIFSGDGALRFTPSVMIDAESATIGQNYQGTGINAAPDKWSEASTATIAQNQFVRFGSKAWRMRCPPLNGGYGTFGGIRNIPARGKGTSVQVQVSSYFPSSTFNFSEATPRLKYLRFSTQTNAAVSQGFHNIYIANSRELQHILGPLEQWTGTGHYVDYDKWETFEWRIDFDDVPASSGGTGRVRLWKQISGRMVKILDVQNQPTLLTPTDVCPAFYMFTYWNGEPLRPTVEQICYADRIIVETDLTKLVETDADGVKIIGGLLQ